MKLQDQTIILIAFMVFVAVVCAINNGCKRIEIVDKPSICDNIEEKSFLCKVADSKNIRLETLSSSLVAANFTAIQLEIYKADDAIKVFEKIKQLIESDVSYAMITDFIFHESKNKASIVAIEAILSEFLEINYSITDFDKKALLYHCNKQISLLELL